MLAKTVILDLYHAITNQMAILNLTFSRTKTKKSIKIHTMIKTKFFVITALYFLSYYAFAEDLLSIYQDAVQNDPKYRAAGAEYRAQLEAKNQSIALFLPTISASANYTDNKNEITTSVNTPYEYISNGYNLQLTQPIYRHENYIALKQADAQIAQAHAMFEYEKQDLIFRVATQYFAVLAAEDDNEFAVSEQKSIKEQLTQTEQRFKAGLIPVTDVHEARARYDQAVARAIVAKNTLAISHETLREITAKNYTALALLSTKQPLIKPEPSDIKQWVKAANTQNALLIASRKNVDIAITEVSRQGAAHYPTLDLTASHSYTDYGDGNTFSQRKQNGNSISLQLNIPLYQGGMISSRTRAAAYRLTQAREKLEQQKRATERQTRNTYLSVIANISQVKALKQALASSSIALKATQAGFEVGRRTAVDVLNSQREMFRARRDYAQARYNYALQTLQLKLSVGTLSRIDIEQLNQWLK